MEFSSFGRKIGVQSGIGQLMDDLGSALSGAAGKEILMLGGGNPAHIPAVQEKFRESMARILQERGAFEKMVGDYDTQQGNRPFLEALAGLLNAEFGWGITSANIVLTNGSQTAFFLLFNLVAGEFPGGRRKRILLPLAPEYIGYTDVGLSDGMFVSARPEIEFVEEGFFKYHVDFDALPIDDTIGAICVSRPTNPTGNVLTDGEMQRLSGIAESRRIPLIIDNAYGTPFPDIIFTEGRPVWGQHTVVCMSLSKLGLPAARTGIIIANEEIVRIVSSMNAVMSLAPTSIGATIAHDLVRSGEIIRMSREIIKPFYRGKALRAVEQLRAELEGVDAHIHRPEGAIFLWLWFPKMPISCGELYERLKARGVLVIPGHHFYPGLAEAWEHRDECIRVTYAQDEAIVGRGLTIIAEEVRRAFASG